MAQAQHLWHQRIQPEIALVDTAQQQQTTANAPRQVAANLRLLCCICCDPSRLGHCKQLLALVHGFAAHQDACLGRCDQLAGVDARRRQQRRHALRLLLLLRGCRCCAAHSPAPPLYSWPTGTALQAGRARLWQPAMQAAQSRSGRLQRQCAHLCNFATRWMCKKRPSGPPSRIGRPEENAGSYCLLFWN